MNPDLMWQIALASGLAALAVTKGVTAEEGTVDRAAEAAAAVTGTIELGAGHVSDDSYRFGRFSGLNDEGPYAIGAFDMHFRPGRPDYLHLQGRNLGLDSRWLSLEYGEQGKYETFLEYSELPHFKMDSAQTPYEGVGSDDLTVAPGASPTNLKPLTLETKRKRIKGGVAYSPVERWKTSLTVSQERKDGTDWIGGALLATPRGMGSGPGIGRTYAVILPEPVDYTTTEIDAALEYNGQQSQWRLNLHGSLFQNANSRVRWEEPGFSVGGGSGPGSGRGLTLPTQGQLSLPPDNQFFQVGLSGSTALTDTTRFTGLLSAGLMQQDDSFLPYGIDGSAAATAALPRDSLDGEVYVYSARAGLTSRPIQRLRLNAQYSYDERDNRTPREVYLYDVMDSGQTRTAKTNEPLSYRKHRISVDANYRFSSEWRGSAGYEFRHTERDFSDVEESRKHTGTAGLKWRPRDDIDAGLRLALSSREASDYRAEDPNQNPLLRKYYLADRDRTSSGAFVNYAPTPAINIGLSADFMDDDYTDSSLGLTDADSRTYNLDVTYYPVSDLQLYAFYTYDRIESRQLGSQPGALPLYRVDFDDRIDTVGLGANLADVANGWDLGISYRYSKGTGDISLTDLDPVRASSTFPTLENELHSVELSAAYDLNKRTRLKFAAIYEQLTAEDWAVDNVSPLPDSRLLTLGNESEDYDVVAFAVAVQYRF